MHSLNETERSLARHLLQVVALLLLLWLDEVDEIAEWMTEQVINGSLVFGDEFRTHKAVLCILNQLSKVNHKAPRERPLCLQTFKQNSANSFLYASVRLIEQD